MQAIRRIVFFGSPPFAVPALDALASSRFRPVLVVTQPARPAGRGRRDEEPAVAMRARELGIEVRQPETVKDPAFLEAFGALGADLAVVVAFGQIFPQALLVLPRLGCVNLHASLLPRHRGAAPIQAAIAAGDCETGVTTMLMAAGLDTGPILLQRGTPIRDEEDAPALASRLAVLGADLVIDTIEGLERENLLPRPQDHALATFAPRLSKRDALIDWSLDAASIARRARAYRPWPGLVTLCGGEPLKVIVARPLDVNPSRAAAGGTFLGVEDGAIAVAAGGGTALGLVEVQRPGRRPLPALEFLRGERLVPGALEFATPPVED